MRKTLFVLLLGLLLFVACTHTVNVPLTPDYQTNLYPDNELSKVKPAITFFAGEYADKTTDNTKLATFKQQVHTYNLYGQRPMDEAFFEGLAVLMTTSGHEFIESGEGDVKINLQFLSMQAERNAGMINVGATSSVQFKLDFIDPETDDIIYTNIYNGQDDRSQAMIGLMDMVNKSIHQSMINCIQSIGDDANLAKALQKFIS